jgi:hypothetical protein
MHDREFKNTENKISTEAEHHLSDRSALLRVEVLVTLTVYFRPNRLQRNAPTITPGNAIAPSNNWNSAVFLMLPSLMTLDMMVPEKIPLGKVTW